MLTTKGRIDAEAEGPKQYFDRVQDQLRGFDSGGHGFFDEAGEGKGSSTAGEGLALGQGLPDLTAPLEKRWLIEIKS